MEKDMPLIYGQIVMGFVVSLEEMVFAGYRDFETKVSETGAKRELGRQENRKPIVLFQALLELEHGLIC